MSEHKHVMFLTTGDDGRSWFYCSSCPAVVEVLPRAVGQELKLTMCVVSRGVGGFTAYELGELAGFWDGLLHQFMHDQDMPRSGRRKRRRARAA